MILDRSFWEVVKREVDMAVSANDVPDIELLIYEPSQCSSFYKRRIAECQRLWHCMPLINLSYDFKPIAHLLNIRESA